MTGILAARHRIRLSVPLVLVVVEEFFAGVYRPNGVDEDPSILDHGLAVGVAGVIDVARVPAIDGCIDALAPASGEEKGVMGLGVAIGVTAVSLRVADNLSGVFRYARALTDLLNCERAAPRDWAASDFVVLLSA
jgi:hypothetical protein